MAKMKARKGMPSVALTKARFMAMARERFVDPAFEPLQNEIAKIPVSYTHLTLPTILRV